MEPEDIERLKRRITEEEEKRKQERKEQERVEKEESKKKQKEERRHMARGDSTTGGIADLVLYAGVLYIGYKVLTSWNIIQSPSRLSNSQNSGWIPLNNQQIESIKSEQNNTIVNYSKSLDLIDERTGRGRMGHWGFAFEYPEYNHIYGMK